MITDDKKYHYPAVKNCLRYFGEWHQNMRETFNV